MQQFAHATANRDYATLCNDVLAPELVAHLTAAGISCKQAMKIFTESVPNPTISVSKVTVNGSSASAAVLAKATGQPSSREAIRLIKTSDGWRLESLALGALTHRRSRLARPRALIRGCEQRVSDHVLAV